MQLSSGALLMLFRASLRPKKSPSLQLAACRQAEDCGKLGHCDYNRPVWPD